MIEEVKNTIRREVKRQIESMQYVDHLEDSQNFKEHDFTIAGYIACTIVLTKLDDLYFLVPDNVEDKESALKTELKNLYTEMKNYGVDLYNQTKQSV